ncbi:hypothetical protein DACRYDRAFT_77677 [Dacryopinax primogenitus]|uniref:Uncharacterized protein n=1 Tax=Dacryopinax primogenitus (strain DJM 731) TaxID=1858805 RepID=M5G0U9_DACPD|nr:uncharacterized protein DACRYDRAFT_77677 [Dacryopinax primogenitus]EJU03876.1 hypothetical protein DACRYDRAFT_77677 [Dacryopinax primogenitus]
MVLIDDPTSKAGPPPRATANPFARYSDNEHDNDPAPPPEYDAGPSLPVHEGAIDMVSSSTSLLPAGVEPGEAPPQFDIYRPQYTVMQSGNIVSHDPHLNEDGEALYRFLLFQSSVRPTMEIRIVGTHSSTTYVETVHRDAQGRERINRTPRHDTVTDFSFRIDLAKLLNPPPEFFTSPDDEPAFRGEMYRETLVAGKKKAASVTGLYERMAWRAERKRRGQTPWSWKTVSAKGTRTVREWADEFCASPKVLKEFEYKKEIYGWDLQELERMIQRTAQNAFYHGMVQVTFPQSGTRIFIRRDSKFARMLSITAVKVILWVLFIYPFILLYKFCWPTGGGKWAVAGEGWTYNVWTAQGVQPLSLQQWWRVWERRIRNAIEERVKSDDMLQTVEDYQFPNGTVTA